MVQNNKRITVFTPTYNRKNTIHRVYDSLLAQTYKDFVWLVIDDGSEDNTKELIESYIEKGKIEIKYVYQKNQGKHIAINNAIKMTTTELFLIADSDDAFVPEALEVFIKAWDSIIEKEHYKGVIARTYDSTTKKPNGKNFPFEQFDANELDANFKLKVYGEKWSIFKTDVLREFPFPEVPGLKFYPETVVWQKMARKYKTRYINVPIREYYRDQENALTNKKALRYKENIFLWEHCINNIFDYFIYNPKLFLKSFVGLVRDGLLNGYSFKYILNIPNSFLKKILLLIFFPIGALLYKNDYKRL